MPSIALAGQILIHHALDLARDGTSFLDELFQADAGFANFEGVIQTPGAWATKTKTVHAADAGVLACIRAMGFTGVAHANNHAFDLGPPGLVATRQAAKAAELALAGSGENLAQAIAPVSIGKGMSLISVDLGPQGDITYAGEGRPGIAPLRMRRAVGLGPAEYRTMQAILDGLGDAERLKARRRVGYSPGPEQGEGLDAFGTRFIPAEGIQAIWQVDEADFARLEQVMAAEKARGAILALALHNHNWDADWTKTPAWLDGLCDRLVEAGADLVLGTGAPVLQPMRIHRGRLVLPGLGNFVFHTGRPATYDREGVDVWRSIAARAVLAPDGRLDRLEVLPIAVARPDEGDGRTPPRPLAPHDADAILARFTTRLSPAEAAYITRLCPPHPVPPSAPRG